jgi:methyltransferase (TIGR00027 family)
MGAASLRAAHQMLDHGAIFPDPLALRILGNEAEALIESFGGDPAQQRLRWFIAMRSRIAEDALAAAVASGICQYVVLGAGLDTFAYRSPFAERLTIFEVDHPMTQLWKREKLQHAAIGLPDYLRFVATDFERETLADTLAAAGFDAAQPTFFSWLGVVPYLTEEAIVATLSFIAGLPGGAEVVFDYAEPASATSTAEGREAREALAARVAAAGEKLQSHFQPDALAAQLTAIGFSEIDDSGPRQLAARFFPGRGDTGSGGSAHVMRASTRR